MTPFPLFFYEPLVYILVEDVRFFYTKHTRFLQLKEHNRNESENNPTQITYVNFGSDIEYIISIVELNDYDFNQSYQIMLEQHTLDTVLYLVRSCR